MKYLYQFSVILFVAILFTSCDQFEQDFEKEEWRTILGPSQLLERMETPVFFHVLERDVVTNEQKGWIVDKAGKVRTYAATTLSTNFHDNSRCTNNQIKTLLNVSDIEVATLDEQDLFQKVSFISLVNGSMLNDKVTNNNNTKVVEFYAFQKATTSNTGCDDTRDGHSCGGGAVSNATKESSYDVVFLKAEGNYNHANEGTQAVQLVEWLKGLQEQENL